MSKEVVKEYSNDELTVIWKPDLCIHSKECWKGLIQVFNPKNRPWVNMKGATTNKIKEQVDCCPSGALTYHNKNKTIMNSQEEAIKVQCMQNGPLLVTGDLEITNSDGSIEKRQKVTAFCRCGASSNKPFCDGKHNDVNFEA